MPLITVSVEFKKGRVWSVSIRRVRPPGAGCPVPWNHQPADSEFQFVFGEGDLSMKLYKNDYQLIMELQKDGRASYSDLAERLGITAKTIAKKTERLLAA